MDAKTFVIAVQDPTWGLERLAAAASAFRDRGLDLYYAGQRERGATVVHTWALAGSGDELFTAAEDRLLDVVYIAIPGAATEMSADEIERILRMHTSAVTVDEILDRLDRTRDPRWLLAASLASGGDPPDRLVQEIRNTLRNGDEGAFQSAAIAASVSKSSRLAPVLDEAMREDRFPRFRDAVAMAHRLLTASVQSPRST
jgi:hypothetical protein